MTEDTTQRPSRRKFGLIAAALVALGGAGGAITVAATRPSATMAPAVPVAISALKSGDNIVTIRGRVDQIYGNKVVIADASGRALVDLGREGEDGTLVSAGQAVTVQGRFDRGFMRAAFLVGADGKVTALGPMHGPDHGPGGPGGPGGKGPRPGPYGDRASPPPPPVAPASAPAAAVAPAANAPAAAATK
jgi:uncharacterized protein YdeI (BOF family)